MKFFQSEAAGGIVMAMAAGLALIAANSPLAGAYESAFAAHSPALFVVNDALMVIFFYTVGLEIRREWIEGALSTRAQAALPALAAIGGMAVPALIFYAVNRGAPENLRGWAIPSATDIAFALGVLSLLGSRVPVSLKILLTAIAVIDDLGAILIIALFYAAELHVLPLFAAGAAMGGLFVLNRIFARNSRKAVFSLCFACLSFILWAAVLKSGVHPTVAGVAAAMFVPARDGKGEDALHAQMRALHPWVTFAILPLFAFANAGVSLVGMGFHTLADPLTLGIVAGLFLGKQAGIFGTVWLSVKSGRCPRPEGATWTQIYGVALLCGVGFTMSLFIGALAFDGEAAQGAIRLGVLTGSVLSAVAGYWVLRLLKGI